MKLSASEAREERWRILGIVLIVSADMVLLIHSHYYEVEN